MNPQNSTVAQTTVQSKDDSSVEAYVLSQAQEDFVAYTAFGGLIPDADNGQFAKQVSLSKFADMIHVDRGTLYNWRKAIPNFWDLVNAKRRELNGKDRLSMVWNGVAMKAASGDMRAAHIYLKNFDPNYIDPNDKVEQETLDGFADAMEVIERRKQLEVQNPIEGEVVSADGR